MTLEESLELISNERASLIEQFEVEPLKNQNLSQLTALKRENRAKNRYTDVLPYDDTRLAIRCMFISRNIWKF